MNGELSDYIKKNFMLVLTIDLQDDKNVFPDAPVSPINVFSADPLL